MATTELMAILPAFRGVLRYITMMQQAIQAVCIAEMAVWWASSPLVNLALLEGLQPYLVANYPWVSSPRFFEWINLTYPICNWGYNPLTIRGMSRQVPSDFFGIVIFSTNKSTTQQGINEPLSFTMKYGDFMDGLALNIHENWVKLVDTSPPKIGMSKHK